MTEPLTRTCFKCGETKPAWEFPRNKTMRSGRDVRCVDCVRNHRTQFEMACKEKFNRRRYSRA